MKNSTPIVTILLASYNGEEYIAQQLDSLMAQTYKHIKIVIRDDGSSDNTYQIVKEYVERYPETIEAYKRQNETSGAASNFFELCRIAESIDCKYFMFCDQDDVWREDKVQCTLDAMLQAEKIDEMPMMIHTDLSVTDSSLNTIGESFIKYRALDAYEVNVNRLLVQNNATGCTMMINKSLLQCILQVKNIENVAMHDWWITLVAACLGKIIFLDKSTMLYRQHQGNEIGATKVNTIGFIIKRLLGNNHVKKTLHMSVIQAKELENTYGDMLSDNSRRYINALASIESKNKFARMATVLRYKLLKQGWVQIVGELMFI